MGLIEPGIEKIQVFKNAKSYLDGRGFTIAKVHKGLARRFFKHATEPSKNPAHCCGTIAKTSIFIAGQQCCSCL
jgi:hypothetical protein